jgi:N-methylhydantoinase A
LHAAAIAEELGMRSIVVPPLPGNFSALGLLIADVRRDFVRTRVSATAKTSLAEVQSTLQALAREGETELDAAGFPPQRRRFQASLDMRYVGQSFELSVPVALDVQRLEQIEAGFRSVYAARYGAATDAATEIVSYRLAAWGLTDKPALPVLDRSACSRKGAVCGVRMVIFGGAELQVSVFDRDRLPTGLALEGPALVEEDGSTTIIPPGWEAELDPIGCLVFRRS